MLNELLEICFVTHGCIDPETKRRRKFSYSLFQKLTALVIYLWILVENALNLTCSGLAIRHAPLSPHSVGASRSLKYQIKTRIKTIPKPESCTSPRLLICFQLVENLFFFDRVSRCSRSIRKAFNMWCTKWYVWMVEVHKSFEIWTERFTTTSLHG